MRRGRGRLLRGGCVAALLAAAPSAPAATDDTPAGGTDCEHPAGFARDLCASEAYVRADAELNRAYRRARQGLRAAQGSPDCSACGEAASGLASAQRAWISFRDLDCDAVYAVARDGAERDVARMDCLIEHTRIRTDQLRRFSGSP